MNLQLKKEGKIYEQVDYSKIKITIKITKTQMMLENINQIIIIIILIMHHLEIYVSIVKKPKYAKKIPIIVTNAES